MFSTLRRTADNLSARALSMQVEGTAHSRLPIRVWLLIAAALVLITLSVGGMTRLTNSGLSITEWDPIMGVIPPLSEADWTEQFDKYKTTYEYRHVNRNMTLDEFRYIYNWEWRHRIFARLIFLTVFFPFIYFVLKGRLSRGMQQRVIIVMGLIVLQGFIGWLMVQSGLRSDVKVSPYRLALHLGMASLLFAMLVAMAFGQDDRAPPGRIQDLSRSRLTGRAIIGLLFALILFGALVAGLRGGRAHDTWPLMEGSLIPGNMFVLSPWIANFFENPLTAQWFHRLIAYMLLAVAAMHWRGTLRRDEPGAVRDSALWLLIAIGAQLLVGIITVLNQVPLPLGLLHQLWAFGLLGLAIWHLYEIERYAGSTLSSGSDVRTTMTTTSGPLGGQTITSATSAVPVTAGSAGGTVLVRPAAASATPFPVIGGAPATRIQAPSAQSAGQAERQTPQPVPFRRPGSDA